jgi:pimeloyl-ACP methyl ester carboxylesterase
MTSSLTRARVAPLAIATLMCVISMLALPASAGQPPTRTQLMMVQLPDPRSLRDALARYADSTSATNPSAAAEARTARGMSAWRAGLADSAIADFERAVALRNGSEEQEALADARTDRAKPGDLDAVAALIERVAPAHRGVLSDVPLRGRLGWALALGGKPDSAMRVFRPWLGALDAEPMWREHIGRAAALAGESRLAIERLLPLAVSSRGEAAPTIAALRAALTAYEPEHAAQLDAVIRQRVAQLTAAERITVEHMGGHRLLFKASDGFPLGGAVFAGLDRQPVAVMLMSASDSLAGYDSLVVVLRRSGLAVVLVDRRGNGASAGPGLSFPWDWRGREDALEARVARDAFDALREAARVAPLDTTRVLIGGMREAATTAILAATLSPRVRAMLLVSPDPAPVDQGVSCARIAKLHRPLFIQLAPEDLDRFVVADALYQAGYRSASRVADARSAGTGAEQFRGDPAIGPRFARWWRDALTLPAPATPPAKPH